MAFLHEIRDAELQRIATHLKPGARILELGGGTGYQARALTRRGFDVTSVDVADSEYATRRVFQVLEYDGVHLPFDDASFDIVFSSNVLEHVRQLSELQAEIRRVLRPGGYCVHVLPTGAWRAWSNVTHFMHHAAESARAVRSLAALRVLKHAVRAFVPARHGETGNALTELYTFSRRYWLRCFAKDGYAVVHDEPMDLFYTGYSVVGERWPLSRRATLSRYLGSACVLYVLHPDDAAPATSA